MNYLTLELWTVTTREGQSLLANFVFLTSEKQIPCAETVFLLVHEPYWNKRTSKNTIKLTGFSMAERMDTHK